MIGRKQEPKKAFAVDDLLSSVATPLKRSRPTNHSSGSSYPSASTSRNGGGNMQSSSPDAMRVTPSTARLMSLPRSGLGMNATSASSPLGTGNGSDMSLSATPSRAPPPAFSKRPNPLTLDSTPLGDKLSFNKVDPNVNGGKTRVGLATFMGAAEYTYRYMYERMMERSEVLDNSIDEAGEILKEYYRIEELGDPSVQTQTNITCVGRICPEVALDSSSNHKLTLQTTYLESSRMLGSGNRVLLQFNEGMKVRGAIKGSGGMGIFPGAMVGVTGRNGGGSIFGVDEIIMMPPILDPYYTKPSQLLKKQYGTDRRELGGSPLNVIVAAGPYTVDADLEFEPLEVLLEQVGKEKPDVIVLIGPFVDSSHPHISSFLSDLTPAQIFRTQIASRLDKLHKTCPTMEIILIPNGRDLISHHGAYPQSPLERSEELGLPQKVRLLPNPTTFTINDLVFAVSSVDVVFHLKSQQLFVNAEEVVEEGEGSSSEIVGKRDDLAEIGRTLLRQRSFYPIFPSPAPTRVIDPLNLDITHQNLIKLNKGADILIVPSMIKSFVKTVDSTIILNPSYLCNGNKPGTFSRLSIGPTPRSELEHLVANGVEGGEKDEAVEHRVWSRCRVEIVKI